jgi:glucokinase
VASGAAISRAAREAIEFGDGEFRRLARSETPTPLQVAQAAEGGSVAARGIFEGAGRWIGQALANVVCVLNPRVVIVGGGVALAGDLLLEPIRRELESRTVVFARERGGVEVVQSPLLGEAGALGSAVWAMQGLAERRTLATDDLARV